MIGHSWWVGVYFSVAWQPILLYPYTCLLSVTSLLFIFEI